MKSMDLDELEALLDAEYSDKNIEIAITWLKSQKLHSKHAGCMIDGIFNHPKFQSELPEFTDWARKASWTFAIDSLHSVECADYLDWVINLAVENPNHPQTGELWAALLLNCRNERLKKGATEWLTKHKSNNKNTKHILYELLRLKPTEEIVKKAKRSANREHYPFLLPVLIEYVGDDESIHIGCRMLASGRSTMEKVHIIEALLKINYAKHEHHLRKFVEANVKDKYLGKLFLILGGKVPQSGRFLCQFISENFKSPLAKELMENSMLFIHFGNDLAIAWEWFCDSKQTATDIAIFKKILESCGPHLARQAEQYLTEWLSRNAKHPKFKKILEEQQKLQDYYKAELVRIQSDDPDRSIGRVLYLAKGFQTEESVRLAQEWFDRLPNRPGSMRLASEIFKQTRSQKSFLQAKEFLRDGIHDHRQRVLLAELLSFGDDEVLSWAIDLLQPKAVYRNYDTLYTDMGKILLSILKTQPLNEVIALRTKEWLSIHPNKEETTSRLDILEAVMEASIDNIKFNPQHLLHKCKEINDIFAVYGDFAVNILNSVESDATGREPDVEIIVNMDETQDEDIVVCITKNSQAIETIHPHERHDFSMNVCVQLTLLLGCRVNVVDERGLETSYPITYSKLLA